MGSDRWAFLRRLLPPLERRVGDWVTDRRARRPSGRRACEVYGAAGRAMPRDCRSKTVHSRAFGKVNLAQKLAAFDEPWSPKIVAELNGMHVKVVKLEGEFVWHHHDDEDELFLVVSGRLVMQLRGGDVMLEPGELIVVPRGVEHCPRTEGECHVVLIEPKTTLNTGNVRNERTREQLDSV